MRNTADGKVEGEAQGEDTAIQRLVEDLGIGPSHAKVDNVVKNEMDCVNRETGFHVRA